MVKIKVVIPKSLRIMLDRRSCCVLRIHIKILSEFANLTLRLWFTWLCSNGGCWWHRVGNKFLHNGEFSSCPLTVYIGRYYWKKKRTVSVSTWRLRQRPIHNHREQPAVSASCFLHACWYIVDLANLQVEGTSFSKYNAKIHIFFKLNI